MAIFTVITPEQAAEILHDYELGELQSIRGIAAGIENTNYFLTTTQGEYVLTVFEVLKAKQLRYYIELMHYLAEKKQPVPMPQRRKDGELYGDFKGKPLSIVTRLPGQSELKPTVQHCQVAARTQARLHLAAQNFEVMQGNLRGLEWWQATAPSILPYLSDDLKTFYQDCLQRQIETQSSRDWRQLPYGPSHCDYFKDNILFTGSAEEPQMGGVIDFYFAGNDKWLFDIAVAVNDWCIEADTGALKAPLVNAWLQTYAELRPFTVAERALWPLALQAAALRFWTSRLYDYYLPRPAETLTPHDPTYFERILKQRCHHPENIPPLP
ncbi:homoserine kinase [Brackiella oedipodis]|uniref:homoserine kinase n=1 Tax=Brackiella oedipodis TaxID=124225 RepID=UPI0004902DAE|nr:homoserine kinase [Brackiella oedipodis]